MHPGSKLQSGTYDNGVKELAGLADCAACSERAGQSLTELRQQYLTDPRKLIADFYQAAYALTVHSRSVRVEHALNLCQPE